MRPPCAICLFASCLVAARAALAASLPAIGQPWIVDTSVPAPLQTGTLQVPPTLTGMGKLQYEIGFSTRETPALGALFDSLTLTVARGDGSGAANVATADVFGLSALGFGAGSLLSGGSISDQQVTPSGPLMGNPATQYAFSIEVTLPPSLVGTELQTTFNFFNNGDDVPTQAYATLIPEPATVGLSIMGIAFVLAFQRKRVFK